MFGTEQITEITTSLNTAISNTLTMFTSLLPVFATIVGVGFGIKFVKGLFNRVGSPK